MGEIDNIEKINKIIKQLEDIKKEAKDIEIISGTKEINEMACANDDFLYARKNINIDITYTKYHKTERKKNEI